MDLNVKSSLHDGRKYLDVESSKNSSLKIQESANELFHSTQLPINNSISNELNIELLNKCSEAVNSIISSSKSSSSAPQNDHFKCSDGTASKNFEFSSHALESTNAQLSRAYDEDSGNERLKTTTQESSCLPIDNSIPKTCSHLSVLTEGPTVSADPLNNFNTKSLKHLSSTPQKPNIDDLTTDLLNISSSQKKPIDEDAFKSNVILPNSHNSVNSDAELMEFPSFISKNKRKKTNIESLLNNSSQSNNLKFESAKYLSPKLKESIENVSNNSDSRTENSSIEISKCSITGLENVPVIGTDFQDEANIEFSYSAPQKLNELMSKWTPKINDVISIIEEEVIEYSDDENEQSTERIQNGNTIYINEDAIKQEEEFENENDVLNDEMENLGKVKDELNISFDENKVKREFNINDGLCIKLDKMNPLKIQHSFSIANEVPKNRNFKNTLRNRNTSRIPNRKNDSKRKSLKSKKAHLGKKKPIKRLNRKKIQNSKSKSLITKKTHEKCEKSKIMDERRSLRLLGKEPEVTVEVISDLTVSNPLFTSRSGKKRCLPMESSTVRKEKSGEKPAESSKLRRPLSPSNYKRSITEMFVCLCCNHKYLSLEQVKDHLRTHFPNVKCE